MSRDIGFYYSHDIYQIIYTGLDTVRIHSKKSQWYNKETAELMGNEIDDKKVEPKPNFIRSKARNKEWYTASMKRNITKYLNY